VLRRKTLLWSVPLVAGLAIAGRSVGTAGEAGITAVPSVGRATHPSAAPLAQPVPSKPAVSAAAVSNRAPLAPNAFNLLPLTVVKPKGWLRRQLEIQAAGLGGHLDEFWPDLGPESAWLGGTGEGWERGPYFLDGLLPLAYLLDDPKLKAKAQRWIDWTLNNQRTDGAIGPPKNTDWWPNMIMLKVLTQYHEATGDPRVLSFMTRYFAYQASKMSEVPLKEWAIYRWQDEVLSVLWLYNRTGDAKLLDLARRLHEHGFDWRGQFANFRYTDKVTNADAKLNTHVVNNAMALKASAIWSLVSRSAADRGAARHQLETMDRYHLLPGGVHSGDEHYAGRSPSQGTELCAVVEGMFSVEHLLAVLGEPALGDRLEKMAYNALPGAFDGNMWAHQYDQQPNQVLCSLRPRQWTTNGPESNLFGLEPHFGCCTANFHQGWPKLVSSLWMATPGGGLVAAAYAPSEVRTTVPGGVDVTVAEDTDYPFREIVRLTLTPTREVTFPLLLRIPAWAAGAELTVNGAAQPGVRPGTFHRVQRTWKPGDRVQLRLPMRVRASRWFNESTALERGPLVFSLKIGEDWRQITQGMKNPARPPAKDWEVHPTTPWNYGLAIGDEGEPPGIEVEERPIGSAPFSPAGAPVELRVKGRRLSEWVVVEGSAAAPPRSPAASSAPLETLTLIPYGSAKLRITAFPRVRP
jgi:beta-L-arabinofuranosidase (glycosyl hydrolase family 127)/glycosyl hydrolase family 127 (putative beta-L-arabinofuranosidase)